MLLVLLMLLLLLLLRVHFGQHPIQCSLQRLLLLLQGSDSFHEGVGDRVVLSMCFVSLCDREVGDVGDAGAINARR